jgi:hypothetical protein
LTDRQTDRNHNSENDVYGYEHGVVGTRDWSGGSSIQACIRDSFFPTQIERRENEARGLNSGWMVIQERQREINVEYREEMH